MIQVEVNPGNGYRDGNGLVRGDELKDRLERNLKSGVVFTVKEFLG